MSREEHFTCQNNTINSFLQFCYMDLKCKLNYMDPKCKLSKSLTKNVISCKVQI